MKQGHIVNRIVMVLLLGGVLTYLGVSAWRGLAGRMTTVISYSYTLDDVAEATGFLARSEYVLPAQSNLADVLPAEGEKVAVNEAVAYLYQDAAALARTRELRELDRELEQLKATAASTGRLSDNARLTEEIMNSLTTLRAGVAGRDFTDLEEDALTLKSLVYQRDYTFESGGDVAGLQSNIDQLGARRSELAGRIGQDTEVVRADRSGVFSGVVDGYENLLVPGHLGEITPSTLDSYAAHPPAKTGGAVGKLITNTRWYFVCAVSEEQAERLTEGYQYTLRFSRDWSGEVSMRVERVGLPENGRVSVVFSSTHYLSETTLLRRQSVDIVYSSVSGIRVPKNALYQDVEGAWSEAGTWGVFAVVGAQAEFKPITVLGDDEDYYLVEPLVSAADQDEKQARLALRPGDEIIMKADGLFDGKVVRS